MGGYDEDENDFYNTEELNSGIEEDEQVDESLLAKTHTVDPGVVGDLEVDDTDEDNSEGTAEEVEDESALAKSYSLDSSLVGDLEIEDDDDDSDIYSPEERLRLFADSLISCCVGGKEINRYALDRLISSAKPELFRDENYIIYSVLYAYRSKLRRISIDEEFLKLFLNRNRGMITKSKLYIDINAYGDIDGSVELAYIGGVVKHFTRLCGMEPLSESDFELNFEKYIVEFKAIEADKIYNTAKIILTDGMRIGRKNYFGFDDSFNYTKVKLAEVEGLVETGTGTGFITMNEVMREEKASDKKPIKIGDFDRITALNDVYGGIYTSMFYQVLAPPKAGKTKFCARICHTVTVKYGINVSVWAQEGGLDAWTAQMRAIHFDYTYNTGKDITEKKYGVTQEVIMHDNFPNAELKELEMSSKQDLESNLNYGVVGYIDRPFVVETFLDDIDTSVKENNSKMVIIDYLQLIGSVSGLSERERVSQAYRDMLVYCKNNNIAVLSPGQFKQEVINDLLSRSDTGSADMRTSGGTSSEVFRTPDVILTLWASTQDLANNTLKILSTPARMSKTFPEIECVTELGTCQFISVNK